MKFKYALLISLAFVVLYSNGVFAFPTESTTEASNEKKQLKVRVLSTGRKSDPVLWPMPHGVLTDLPKNMLPAHRSPPKNLPAIPAH